MANSRKPRPALDPVRVALRAALERHALSGAAICVAFSGGLDSTVLLHALVREAKAARIHLTALHVNHGLSPNARRWEAHCRQYCVAWGVPLTVRRVRLVQRGRVGLEAAARRARYGALAQQQAAVVALAHHEDDQAETLMLNLLRGTGLTGAAGMPAWGQLPERAIDAQPVMHAWRPLLTCSRAQLMAYATRYRLQWVEDESNTDHAYQRNWVRHALGEMVSIRYPRWRSAFARAAKHFAAANALLSADASVTERLTVRELRSLSTPRASQRLRDFLSAAGTRAPSARQLAEMLRQIQSVSADGAIQLPHAGWVLRVWRGELALLPFALPAGEVQWRRCRGEGISLAKLKGLPLQVRQRSGGERLQLALNRPSRSLKNLCQEAGIPPWERDVMPLVFVGQTLVWVPGIGVDVRWRATSGRIGLLPNWTGRANGG
jgi:tRNA(Ile)-lysidine synthase